MKKVLIIRCPLESAEGGAEHQTMWLADGLRQRGYTIEFLGSCPVLLRWMRERGYIVHPLNIGAPPVTLTGALSFLWRRRHMRQCLQEAIDRCSYGEPLSIFMLSLTEKLLVTEMAASEHRVYWIEHDRIGRWLRKNPWLPLLRRQHQHATMITVSELSRDLMIECGFDAKRIVPIPNGVPLPTLPTLPQIGRAHV